MMVALGVAAMSVWYYYHNAFMMRKMEDQKLVHVSNLTAYMQSVKALLKSQGGVMLSAQLPANDPFLQCLNDPEYDCQMATEQNFILMNEDGTVFNDPTKATAGIDSLTLACDSFPSVNCPFRYQLKWSRECVGMGPCRSPDLFIRGELVVGGVPGIKYNINPVNYSFQVKIR